MSDRRPCDICGREIAIVQRPVVVPTIVPATVPRPTGETD